MELLLKRRPTSDDCTLGQLFVNGVAECFTLEDLVRDGPKVMHETAIPAGRYSVAITQSQRFGRMLPELLDVPGFTGVRIHPGNTAADTSGCILVGHSSAVSSVADSRLAMAALQPKIASALARGEDVFIEIHDADTIEPLKA
jgi:hypothetical protein